MQNTFLLEREICISTVREEKGEKNDLVFTNDITGSCISTSFVCVECLRLLQNLKRNIKAIKYTGEYILGYK